MNSVLMENFGTNNIIVRCSCFDETVQVTNKFHEMGFLRTKNSDTIANGKMAHRWLGDTEYWEHPYIDEYNKIHYYYSGYDFSLDSVGDYEICISFQDFINLFEEIKADDLELSDVVSNLETFLLSVE